MRNGRVCDRIEKLWSMARIAREHGQISFESVSGKVCEKIDLCGLRFVFEDRGLVRVRGGGLDVVLVDSPFLPSSSAARNLLPLPPLTRFLQGDDAALDRCCGQILPLGELFQPVKQAA